MKNSKQDYDELSDDLLTEYEFDYSKAKINPYFRKNRTFVEVDSEVARVFENSENINEILKVIANSISRKKIAVI